MLRQNSGLDALTIPLARSCSPGSPTASFWSGKSYPCHLRIELEKNVFIQARSFEFYPKQCVFKSGDGRTVLEHHFSEALSSRRYHPWRHAGEHDPFTVAFTTTEAREFRLIVDSKQVPGTPKYEFDNVNDYQTFNTQLYGRRYLREFVPKEIDSNLKDGKSHSSVIKVWEEEGDEPECSVTLPVVNERRNISFLSLPFKWFRCEEHRPAVFAPKCALKLTLVGQRSNLPSPVMGPDKTRRRSSLLKGRLSFGSAINSGNASDELPFVEPELTRLRERYGYFIVTFNNVEDCKSFRLMHEDRPAPSRTSSRSGAIASPESSPRPPISISDQQSTKTPVDSAFAPTHPRSDSRVGRSEKPPMSTAELGPSENSSPLPELVLPPSVSQTWPEDTSIHTRFHDNAGADLCRQGGPAVANVTSDAGFIVQQHGIYGPLNTGEIRLLLIRKGDYEDPLWCSLETHPLEHAVELHYEAVSYCWGRLHELIPIMVTARHSFKVSQHLWEGLRRLRLEAHDRLVWIDAVCINQADIREKNHQIPLMRRIYESAQRTLIWIGNIGMGINLENCTRTVWAEQDDKLDKPTLCLSGSTSKDLPHGVDDIRRALKDFYNGLRESTSLEVWWKRLWVIQEFHFSRRPPIVYIGFHSMNWKHFAEMLKSITEPDDQLAPFHKLGTTEHRTLFDLLCSAGPFHCNDPRDRIYGLLSMQSPPKIEPEYSKSVLKVYEETCLYLIEEAGSVDVLLDDRADRACWNGSIYNVMPTWIPDLRLLLPQDIVQINEGAAGTGQHGRISSASLVHYISAQESVDVPSLLSIRCIKFERITRRTTSDDFKQFVKTSPSGSLIYYSLERRGHLLNIILDKLEYSVTAPTRFNKLERRPYLSQLMLDYVFENKRSFVEEHRRRMQRKPDTAIFEYEAQCKKDVAFVHNNPDDVAYVEKRWSIKKSNAKKTIFIPDRLKVLLEDTTRRDHESIINDFNIAREFENLFAYARTTQDKYYFVQADFDAPMREDVLSCNSVEEANQLQSRWKTDEPDPEYHFYNAKNRERDFFITEGGFLGLGPAKLEENDLVIVPIGSSLPWIVREHRSGDIVYYTFIGEAVVPSIMSGALLLQQGAEEEDIQLR